MDVLYLTPSWLISLVVLALMLVAMETGFRLTRKREQVTDRMHGTFGGLTAAVLALLGLLLAFAFSLSAARYDLRQDVLAREVSAIETCYRRAALLEEPAAGRLRQLLRAFVQGRVEYHDAGFDSIKLDRAVAEIERLEREMWSLVMAEGQRRPPSPRVATIADAIDAVIHAKSARNMTYRVHVSEAVMLLLLLNGVASAFLVGCTFGMARYRGWLGWAAFALLTSLMIYTILDMDRPRRGIIRVGQQPMLELRDDLSRDAAGPGGDRVG